MCDIAIVVPAHCAAKTIEKSINSVLNQNFKNFELILVDDVPGDETGEICDRYAEIDSRVKTVHLEASVNLSEARNIGIEYAKSNYICFLDSDDEIAAGALQKAYELAKKTEAEIVIGSKLHIDEADKSSIIIGPKKGAVVFRRQEIIQNLIQQYFDNSLPGLGQCNLQSILFNQGFLNKNAIRFNRNQTYGEDVRFTLEAYSVASIVALDEIPFHIYHYDSRSVSNKWHNKYMSATIESYKYQFEIINKTHLPKKCFYNLVGKTFVGINSVMLTQLNRGANKKELRKYMKEAPIKNSLTKILFMRSKNLIYADISNRQRITALFYLLGMYKRGLSFEQTSK